MDCTITVVAVIEIQESVEENLAYKLNIAEKGFDPINLGGKIMKQKHFMHEAEFFNKRLGVLAISLALLSKNGSSIVLWWIRSPFSLSH